MTKIKAYWNILIELFFAPIAYALGIRPYTINVRYADTDTFDPFTDVLINTHREEPTAITAITKMDDFETALYSALPIENIKITPARFWDYLQNHFAEILMFAS